MPSLLDKLSYYDPETGGTFVIAGDNFLWKNGKKSPEESKVTKLVRRYGWKLVNGDDIWLTFRKEGTPGQILVIRGVERWSYDIQRRGNFLRTTVAEGVGLESLHDALEKGLFAKARAHAAAVSKERALDLIKKLEAYAESAAVAGNKDAKTFADKAKALRKQYGLDQPGAPAAKPPKPPKTGITCPHCGGQRAYYHTPTVGVLPDEGDSIVCPSEFGCGSFTRTFTKGNPSGPCPACEGRKVYYTSKQGLDMDDPRSFDSVDTVHCSACEAMWPFRIVGVYASAGATAVNNAGNGHESVDGDPLSEIHVLGSDLLRQARELMHDDSGALTGLRSRPDYGESDSHSVEMNKANSKGACLVLTGGVKTASGTKQAELYVASVEYERGRALKLTSFQYSPDPMQAKVFGRRTAENLALQIRGLCGASVRVAAPSGLLTTQNIKTQKKPRKDLLTQHNTKTQKGETKGFLTGVMHMMPSDLAGYGNVVCPCASPECRKMCLNTAGEWANAPAIQNARRVKTELYFKNRPQFMADMRKSIKSLVRKAEKENLTPAVRINGTSDLPQVAMEMAREFPDVQFYDYSKIGQPWKRQLPNYHITFSRSEINDKEAMEALEHGVNVAVVFSTPKGEPLPKEWRGYPVIDGDLHDLRFLDKFEGEGSLVIGLRGKGKARGKNKGTESGFVVDPKTLVQIGPSIAPAPKKEPPRENEPVSTTEQRIQERTRPATQSEEELESVTASTEDGRVPHNEWFIEGCFDDAHLYV